MKEKKLIVSGSLIKDGIDIKVLSKHFKIKYPLQVWNKTPQDVKKMLLDNLTFGDTHFLPITLGYGRVSYNTRLPVAETFLYRNQMMDMLKSEKFDHAPYLSYIKQFYNLEYDFSTEKSSPFADSQKVRKKNKKPIAIIPFTFGKESLTSFAICRELGISPILVYSQEPSQPHEEAYKKRKLKELEEKFGVITHYVENGPGLFRYDTAFNKKKGTEVGWGSQTTLIGLQMIPFVYAYNADYMLFGSEYLNNEYEWKDGWKVFLSADQTTFFTQEQDMLIRLLTHDTCRVHSTLEPMEEVNIFYMLHHRYSEIGKYQFSCTAEKPLYEDSQWCHTCYKCARMYLFAKVCDIDPSSIGFKKDLLNEKGLFSNYFGAESKSGSSDELDFCFYVLYKKGVKSPYVELFKKQKLAGLKPWKTHYWPLFTHMQPHLNLPPAHKNDMEHIFTEELSLFKKKIHILRVKN